MMKRRIQTEIDIQAPPERVWRVLLDFGRYHEWSAFITNIAGTAEPGARLRVTLALAKGKPRVFRPEVLQATPPRVLRWLGNLGVPGILDGEHGFFLEPLADGGTRLRQSEIFGGFLALFLWRRLQPPTAAGFAAFNRALKQRAEAGA